MPAEQVLLILVQADDNSTWGHLLTKKICVWSNLKCFKMERTKSHPYHRTVIKTRKYLKIEIQKIKH